jgi:hypothetical protein
MFALQSLYGPGVKITVGVTDFHGGSHIRHDMMPGVGQSARLGKDRFIGE